jgi:hypothetical protein
MNMDLYEFADINRVGATTLEREAPLIGEAPIAREAPKTVVGEERTPARLTMFVRAPLRAASTADWRQWSAVYFPPGVSPSSRTIDVILYLHGHRTGIPGARRTIWAYLKHKCWPLREHLAASGRAAVLIAPTLGPRSQSGTLLAPNGLDRYLEAVLSASRAYWTGNAVPEIRKIVLTGHSGAGAPMRLLANSTNAAAARIAEVWGFDCTYSARGNADATGWARWARSAPQSQLFLYYLRGAPTQNQAVRLRQARLPNVSIIESSATMREGIHPHYWVPIQHWGERLAASRALR